VTLNAAIGDELPFLQAEVEALMTDTCTIKRQTGTALNATTLAMEPTYTTLYTGKCRVQLRDTVATQPDAGERAHAIVRTIVQVPVATTGVRVDDVVTVTASADADLTGRAFRVRSTFHKTHATSRRLECEELQA